MPPRARYRKVAAQRAPAEPVPAGRPTAAPALRRPVVFKPPGFKDELCAFFRGTGTDIECRTLEQILTWDHQLMEVCHDYIQWLLPTDETSKFNSDAPILDPECQRIFREDALIRRNLRRGAQKFVNFLGLVANLDAGNGEPPRIVRAQNFPQRILMCWRGPANHNWKRTSRALRCFGLVGMEDVQQALLTCLEEIIVEYPGMVDEKTIGHWLDEACVKSQLVHSITPGYLAALLGSPNMMASLCKQYFAKFDFDSDGRLELDEIGILASEIHVGLGLPSDAMDQAMLMASIEEFGKDSTLTREEFPRWFAKALKTTLERSEKVHVEPAAPEETPEHGHQQQPQQQPEQEHQHPQPMRSEYVSALLRSPALLGSMCRTFFQKYDANHNGLLEPTEALKLFLELHESLGVPPEFTTEQQIVDSMTTFARGRTGSALDEKQFPEWFQFALKRNADRRYTI